MAIVKGDTISYKLPITPSNLFKQFKFQMFVPHGGAIFASSPLNDKFYYCRSTLFMFHRLNKRLF